MYFTHKIFLKWILYLVVLVFTLSIGVYLNIFQYAFMYDKTFITIGLTIFYGLTELYLGYCTLKTSRELNIANDIEKMFLNDESLTIEVDENTVSFLPTNGIPVEYSRSYSIVDHIANIVIKFKNTNNGKIDQTTLLSNMSEKLYDKNSMAEFSISRIMIAGLIGTLAGLLLTFWPFINVTTILDIASMQKNLPTVYSGVGAAFFPSLFAAGYSLILGINDKLLNGAAGEVVDKIVKVSETLLIPRLESKKDTIG